MGEVAKGRPRPTPFGGRGGSEFNGFPRPKPIFGSGGARFFEWSTNILINLFFSSRKAVIC